MTQTPVSSPPPLPQNTAPSADEVFCYACGRKIPKAAATCPYCATWQQTAVAGGKGKMPVIAWIAIVVGVLFFVVAILGILAAIAIPNYISYRNRSYDAAANADIKNAYTAAQAYFTDYPDGEVTEEVLADYGLTLKPETEIYVLDGTVDNLRIATKHASGKTVYIVEADGSIQKQDL